MKPGLVLLAISMLLVSVLAILCWPELRAHTHDRVLHHRFDTAEKIVKDLAPAIISDPRYSNVNFYPWPMEGVVVVFEGTVASSNDLASLKALAERQKGRIPLKWKISVAQKESKSPEL